MAKKDGVWSFMTAEENSYYAEFLDTYTRVRIAEGRTRDDAELLRKLPDCPASHPLAWQWRIRSRSFARLRRLLSSNVKPGSRILDLGAGNGWLSRHLNALGFNPCAIDISIDDGDGLAAARVFAPDWPRVRATLENLPLPDDAADAAIFNASFHYSEDPRATLAEACRVVAPGGLLAIVDTPFYRHAESGERMRAESQRYFESLIGERSDAIDSVGYLTWDRLGLLGDELGLDWRVERPWYGLGWALRPLRAKLRRGREPAAFAIAWAFNRTPAGTGKLSR